MLKRIITIFIISYLLCVPVSACDICGCGVGSYYVGILPEFRNKFAGIRYQHKSLMTHIGVNGQRTYLTTDESYHIAEAWGALNIGKKIRILTFIPYNFIERVNQGASTRKSGIGDIAVMGYYQFLNKHPTTRNNKMLVHSLWAGAGFKLPTGRYNQTDKNITEGIQNTFQLGTGSMDFTLQAVYDFRIQDAGLNTNLSYKMNTANRQNYQYGNKFTCNTLVYYKFRTGKKSNLAPNAGIMYETSEKDRKNQGFEIFDSGGNSLTATAGLETTINKMSVGLSYQTPLTQQLAEGKVRAGDRLMIHCSFSF